VLHTPGPASSERYRDEGELIATASKGTLVVNEALLNLLEQIEKNTSAAAKSNNDMAKDAMSPVPPALTLGAPAPFNGRP
jgi:hypothetical protein